ncbi:MAG TPA: ATP-binding protein [Chloroflexota bacterium]
MRDSDVDLYTYERLQKEFGPFAEGPPEQFPARVERELVGERYGHILTEMAKIAGYQWQQHLERSALKGFLLHGAVGVGKTTMAKRLTYELCRMMGDSGPSLERRNEVVMLLVDGADIARGRYGDTEEQLRDLFTYARDGQAGAHHRHDDDPMRRTVVLFDDVESLFLTRGSSGAKEWHFSQNSVFFHNIDDLDTAHTIVVLTTNRIDLLDEAIVDRFMPYEFGLPATDVLEEVARAKGRLQALSGEELKPALELIRLGAVKSIREVERLVMRAFVEKVVSL